MKKYIKNQTTEIIDTTINIIPNKGNWSVDTIAGSTIPLTASIIININEIVITCLCTHILLEINHWDCITTCHGGQLTIPAHDRSVANVFSSQRF